MNDKLVEQNPRDALIVMRNQNLVTEKERKIKNNAAEVEAEYSRILLKFSRQFLRSDAFSSLSPMQKKELDKLCASFCRRRVFWNWLPFAAPFSWVIYSASFKDPANLFLMVPLIVVWFITFAGIENYENRNDFLHFSDHISFLFKRRVIKKAERLESKK